METGRIFHPDMGEESNKRLALRDDKSARALDGYMWGWREILSSTYQNPVILAFCATSGTACLLYVPIVYSWRRLSNRRPRMNTAACLSRYPWRTLKALAAVYRLPVHHRHSRQQVAQHLSTAIHAHLAETFAALDPDARAALRALAQSDGLSLPRPEFAARFGPLHPYRPWAPQSPPAPWPTPSSPAATLVHYGLAYPLNLGTRKRPLHAVVLPRDLRDALAPVLDLPALSEPRSAIPSTAAVGGLEADLFTLLSFLNREDTPVRHGRWLPPRALQALNQYLSPPDDLGPGRSELQATRLPFLHYLAERAGLAGLIGDCLKPTLITQQWLAAPRAGRLRTLWEAWLECSAANRTLWLRFHLPALGEDDDPLARFHLLLASLATCPPGPLGHPADLLEALIEQSPALVRPQAPYATWAALSPDEQAAFESRARQVLLALLTGPLAWFGVFVLSTPPLPRPSAPLLLTPLGAALLGRDDGAWPAGPAAAPLRIGALVDRPGAGPAVPLDAPPEVALLDRFALEALG